MNKQEAFALKAGDRVRWQPEGYAQQVGRVESPPTEDLKGCIQFADGGQAWVRGDDMGDYVVLPAEVAVGDAGAQSTAPRTIWIVAQRHGDLTWYRNPWEARRNLTERIDKKPGGTYVFQSFGVDDPEVDFASDKAVNAWLGDFDPWDV